MKPILHGLWLAPALLFCTDPGVAQRKPGRAPVEVQTVLRDFEARLDADASATRVLGQWCADHHLASSPTIQAVQVRNVDKPADHEIRRRLRAGPGVVLRYRRVRLTCGEHVLSEADNWYRPDRLTSDMNQRLDTTDTPFGVVVRPLNFRRKTLAVQWLATVADASPPHDLLRHRAVLVDTAGVPFSLVVETYTAEILADGGLSR